ncbi:MAG: hypothetical protein WEC16_01985 [Anaerolineales bacterium]
METNNRHLGSLVGGLILVAFGLLALLSQWVQDLDFWGTFWPFIIIAFGAMFFVIMLSAGKQAAALAIPGSIFAGIGIMMFIQNLTGYWQSWSYGWTVILMSVGIGIYLMGAWSGETRQREAGKRVFGIGLVMFIVFGAFFEMIFNDTPFAQLVFPIALIVLGGYLIVSRSRLLGSAKAAAVSEPSTKKSRSKK